MFRETKYTAIAAAIIGAFGASNAQAIEFTYKDWKMDINGSVNAFYTTVNCKPDSSGTSIAGSTLGLSDNCLNDQASIQNGLLPGYLKFTAATQQKGLDIKGTIGFWPGTSLDNGAQTVGDVRTVWMSFGAASWGEVKLGRDIGLFQQQAILNDMTLIGVGGGDYFSGQINTTLGMIGRGYIYTEFQPQITYSSPKMGGFQASLGAFQPRNTAGVGGSDFKFTTTPGFQGLASFDWAGDYAGKVWGSFAFQQGENSAGDTRKGNGYELGGKVGFFGAEAMLVGFTGKGLGDAIQFINGHDDNGEKRDSSGFLAQLTYKFGDLKVGASYGQNKLDQTSFDEANTPNLLDKRQAYVLGLYYSLTPNVTLVGEYVNEKETSHSGLNYKADTIGLGAILFF